MAKIYFVHCVDTEGPLYETLDATFVRLKQIYGIKIDATEENLRKLQNRALDLGGIIESYRRKHHLFFENTNQKWHDIPLSSFVGFLLQIPHDPYRTNYISTRRDLYFKNG